MLFRVSEISSLAKCVLTIVELNCHEGFGDLKFVKCSCRSPNCKSGYFTLWIGQKRLINEQTKNSASLKMQICYVLVGKAL